MAPEKSVVFESLEIEGFRGFLRPCHINFSPAFAVIVGRNGTGKTSICDAIEYALSGSLRRFQGVTERRESIQQYLWWRGEGEPANRVVKLTLARNDGERLEIVRGPEGLEASDPSDIETFLGESSVGQSLDRVCETTILRSEDITELGLDVPEADRYAFVRAAVGTTPTQSIERRWGDVESVLSTRRQHVNTEYARIRERVTNAVATLADARTRAANAPESSSAMQTLTNELGISGIPASELLRKGQELTITCRSRVERLVTLAAAAGDLRQKRQFMEQQQPGKSQLNEQHAQITKHRREVQELVKKLETEIKAREGISQSVLRLAHLLEHGSQIGLRDECCPLCGKRQEPEEWEAALSRLRNEVDENANTTAAQQDDLGQAKEKLVRIEKEERALQQALAEREQAESVLVARARELKESTHGLLPDPADPMDSREYENAIEPIRERLARIETATSNLRAASAAEEIPELEAAVTSVQRESSAIEEQIRQLVGAVERIKNVKNSIHRAVGELVDERLAALSPLLKELYERLQPHVDWRDIEYVLRGDVRHFLSLTVGPELNPRFVFSTGQKRALSFGLLLAVHLSRPWCRLKSLVLDDTVQHLDDFRVVHVVEVLAALRRAGTQAVILVEDPALATFLQRRLGMGGTEGGQIVSMAYRPGGGTVIDSVTDFPPFGEMSLLSA